MLASRRIFSPTWNAAKQSETLSFTPSWRDVSASRLKIWYPKPKSSRAKRRCVGRFVMRSYLDFEKPVAELEAKIEELRALNSDGDAIAEEINRIEVKAAVALKELYGGLTPWQKTQVARHPQRPHCLDYVATLIEDFVPLAGDRKHGEDEAIVGGFGRFRGDSICL